MKNLRNLLILVGLAATILGFRASAQAADQPPALKGYDVVLGKLVAGSLNAVYSVVAMLPMLAIPLLMGGGITLAEFGRSTVSPEVVVQ